jgi:hypothetical protein
MKHTAIVILLLAASTQSFCQMHKRAIEKIYLDGGGGPANHHGVLSVVGGTAILKNNWTIAASWYNLDMTPKNLSSDYQRGYTILIIFPFPDEWPSVNLNLVNVTAGRYFQSGRRTWFTTEAGLSLASGETMSFTRQPISDYGFYHSSNYATEKKSQTTIGCIVRTGFKWAFTPYLGLTVGAFGSINSIQSPVGLEFKFIAGWLNTKKK